MRPARADQSGQRRRVPRWAHHLRPEQRALELGSVLQGVRRQLHERGDAHQPGVQGHGGSRRRVFGTHAIHREARLAVQRIPRTVRPRDVAVREHADRRSGTRREHRAVRRAARAIRPTGPAARRTAGDGQGGRRRGGRDGAGGAAVRCPGPVAAQTRAAHGPDAAGPVLRLPARQAPLRALHAGNGGAGHRVPAAEVHAGGRHAARELGTRPHVGVRLCRRVDAAHERRADDRCLRAAPALVRQHRPARRRRHGAPRPRRDSGLHRRADAVPQHSRLHAGTDGAQEARHAA